MKILQDASNNIVLQPDSTGNITLVMQGTTVMTIPSVGNAVTLGTGVSLGGRNNSLSAISNVTNTGNTNGFWFNTGAGRNQLLSQGFTFSQDGDVLTPTNKTRYAYSFTGGNQILTVPTGVYWMYVKLWGAGGGCGRAGGWSYGADGGGGGHTRGLVPVLPGQTMYIVVGSGGYTCNGTTQSVYGGGGYGGGNGDNQYSGQGGGYCGIFLNGISQGQALAIAGGGGGGGSISGQWANMGMGGAGGGTQAMRGLSAQSGTFANGGGGASSNSGGTAGTGNSNGANAGTALQGGNTNSNNYGGNGGGGYWGGGSGSYTNGNLMGGGGGGSGYITPTARYGATYSGSYRTPAMFWDPDLVLGNNYGYIEMLGYGGQNTQNNQGANSLSGGHAYCVLYY